MIDNVNNSTIRGIILDLDDTLYDYSSLHNTAIELIRNRMRGKWCLSENEFDELYDYATKRVKDRLGLNAASHHKLLYFKCMAEKIPIATFSDPYEMYKAYWEYIYDNMKPNAGVLELLDFCQRNGIKTAICTDQLAHIQYNKIKHLEIERYIDIMITSEEVGVEKPSSFIFQVVLEMMNLNRQNVIMIGDDYNKDYLGAKSIGIKALLYNNGKKNVSVDSSYVISDFLDVVKMIVS